MNKSILLSLVAASVLFTGCGEDAKKAVTDAAASATETVKETTANAVAATKEVASEATTSATEAVKEAATEAVESAKEAASSAVEATKEKAADAATALKERAAAATQAAKETATKVVASDERPAVEPEHKTEAVPAEVAPAATAENVAGKAAYAKCSGCHGVDGKTKALGKSALLAGQSVADLESKIAEYKAGTRNVAGMGMLMKGQVASLDEATIKAVSEYISGL